MVLLLSKPPAHFNFWFIMHASLFGYAMRVTEAVYPDHIYVDRGIMWCGYKAWGYIHKMAVLAEQKPDLYNDINKIIEDSLMKRRSVRVEGIDWKI